MTYSLNWIDGGGAILIAPLLDYIVIGSVPLLLSGFVSTLRGLVNDDNSISLDLVPPSPAVPGGVDFTTATRTADGRLCVVKEETVDTLQKDPVLECKHNQEKH